MIAATTFVLSVGISIILNYFYKTTWKFYNYKTKIPTGAGVLLIFFFLYHSYTNNLDIEIFIIIFFASMLYWIDDLRSLTASIRFIIQFITGGLIGYMAALNNELLSIYYLLCLIFTGGLINILFTNVINFYDGLDLNLSTLLIIFSITNIFIFNDNNNLLVQSIIILGFVIGFSVFNSISNNLFFGDSGCFVIASYVTYLILNLILSFDIKFVYFLIPFALPLFDVLYVVILRLYLKENLLLRNYHHLYHRTYFSTKNKYYLLNQVLNVIIILICYNCLLFFKINNLISIVFSICIITPIYYLSIIKILKHREVTHGKE